MVFTEGAGVRRGSGSGSATTNGEDFVGADPVEDQFSFEHTSTRTLGLRLTNSRGGIVHPNPTRNGLGGDLVQSVGERRIAALESGNGDGILFADDVVGTALSVGDEVAVGGDTAAQALVSS